MRCLRPPARDSGTRDYNTLLLHYCLITTAPHVFQLENAPLDPRTSIHTYVHTFSPLFTPPKHTLFTGDSVHRRWAPSSSATRKAARASSTCAGHAHLHSHPCTPPMHTYLRLFSPPRRWAPSFFATRRAARALSTCAASQCRWRLCPTASGSASGAHRWMPSSWARLLSSPPPICTPSPPLRAFSTPSPRPLPPSPNPLGAARGCARRRVVRCVHNVYTP